MWSGCELQQRRLLLVVSEGLRLHRNTMKTATSNNNDYVYDERRTPVHILE